MRDELFAEFHLGVEAEEFLKSNVGRYIEGVAEQEVEALREGLLHVDPDDAKAIRRIQTEIHITKRALQWILEAIDRGREAEYQIHEAVE